MVKRRKERRTLEAGVSTFKKGNKKEEKWWNG